LDHLTVFRVTSRCSYLVKSLGDQAFHLASPYDNFLNGVLDCTDYGQRNRNAPCNRARQAEILINERIIRFKNSIISLTNCHKDDTSEIETQAIRELTRLADGVKESVNNRGGLQ